MGKLLAVCICLIMVSSMLAGLVHSGMGTVKIRDLTFETPDNSYLHALVYIPKNATPEQPAPAVLACHGYNNTAEVQDINSIELSRRGYVVLSLDCYRHGSSGEGSPDAIASGVYSALQYLGTLPYVDTERIGMVGHSMGGGNIQIAARHALINHQTDPSVIVPKAVMPTAMSMMTMNYITKNPEDSIHSVFEDLPVNLGCVFGAYDEFVSSMWGIDDASQVNATTTTTGGYGNAESGMGFSSPEYDTFYRFGNSAPLTNQEDLVAAANDLQLRVLYQPQCTHPHVHFSSEASSAITGFFDLTLRDGHTTIAPSSQIWYWKHIFSGIALLAFFFMTIPLGYLLLETPFFRTIMRKEPSSYAAWKTPSGKRRYWLIYALCMLPAPLLFYLCLTNSGKVTSPLFPIDTINGVLLLNLATGAISLAIFYLLYRTNYQKEGASTANMGIKLPLKDIGKSLLLAFITFVLSYLMLVLVAFFFKVDFRFYVYSIRYMTPGRFSIWLRYLPEYLFFFAVSALTLNMTTRVNGQKEWFNTLIIVIASVFGLVVLYLADYMTLFATGVKLFPTVAGNSTALPGILLWGVIFILPIAAVISRAFFKKTGSIWTGAFINTFMVTLFAVSNAIISTGPMF